MASSRSRLRCINRLPQRLHKAVPSRQPRISLNEGVKGESLMTALPAAAGPPADAAPTNTRVESAGAKKARDDSEARVERVRAWAGLAAVVAGDAAIAIAAIVGIIHFAGSGSSTQG